MTNTQFELLRALLQSIDHNVGRIADACERCEARASEPTAGAEPQNFLNELEGAINTGARKRRGGKR